MSLSTPSTPSTTESAALPPLNPPPGVSERPLRVGIVGFGYATATFHAPLVAGVPGLELAAISSRDPAKVAAAWPGVPVPASPEALFAQTDIDLVVIPTPNETHHPLAAAALAAGKHVVVDKPFTLTQAEARDLIERADAAGRVLSVFHNRRWDAGFLSARALLRSGRLGRLVHAEARFDRYRPQVRARWRESAAPGAGLWYDLGPHLLDEALQLHGTPESITLDLAAQRDGALSDDWFHAVLHYPQGLRVLLHASTLVAGLGPRLSLHGTQGSYLKSGLDTQEDAMKAGWRPGQDPAADAAAWGLDPVDGQLTLADAEGTLHTAPLRNERGEYRQFYAQLREAIRGRGPNPVPGHQALDVMRWLDLGRLSAERGRRLALSDAADAAQATA